jgi:hypothetical protein
MITTCDIASVNSFPLLVWCKKCLIYMGLPQCLSASVLYYRKPQTEALARSLWFASAACQWNDQLGHWSAAEIPELKPELGGA